MAPRHLLNLAFIAVVAALAIAANAGAPPTLEPADAAAPHAHAAVADSTPAVVDGKNNWPTDAEIAAGESYDAGVVEMSPPGIEPLHGIEDAHSEFGDEFDVSVSLLKRRDNSFVKVVWNITTRHYFVSF